MIAVPSICDWMRSGLTYVPQSIAVSTRWHLELALVVDRYFDNGRDIADEAAVHGNAEPVSFRHGPSPLALVRDQLDDAAQAGQYRSDSCLAARHSSRGLSPKRD